MAASYQPHVNSALHFQVHISGQRASGSLASPAMVTLVALRQVGDNTFGYKIVVPQPGCTALQARLPSNTKVELTISRLLKNTHK